jgi:dual specificity phosphatase 12
MDEFLQNGEVSGKIACPNKRCKAKLGNYDWAGAGCGCGQWVTPGFCINRSKVDEIAV